MEIRGVKIIDIRAKKAVLLQPGDGERLFRPPDIQA